MLFTFLNLFKPPRLQPMINTLITSKTRVKLLLKLFLNTKSTGHLRGMAEELGESSNSIRVELNRFTEAGLLISEYVKNKKIYRANTEHPMYNEINGILRKATGIDGLVKEIISRIDSLDAAYLTGDIAEGINSAFIDLVLVGENLDKESISRLIAGAAKQMNREITYLLITSTQMDHFLKDKSTLLIYNKNHSNK